jgi:hypothetical protein
MTEQEWLRGEEVDAMLAVLGSVDVQGPDRKMWLLACACTRALLQLHESAPDRRCGEVAERFADGEATPEELGAADHDTYWDIRWYRCWPWSSAGRAVSCLREETLPGSGVAAAKLPSLLRCIFGNPFRPCTLDGSLLTPTVVGLAEAAYEDRVMPGGLLDPARLAVLADALEEAGAGGALLDHLRGPGEHCRGCWAIDLLTGRS